ncbi:MAG TPA: polysaccharide biosynthesis/export family protein [Vicinamibacteria bacterium]
MRRFAWALALAGAGLAAAQAPKPSTPPAAAPPLAAPPAAASPIPASPEYRVGPGDVLEVTVLGNEDLSRTPTVQTSGTIALPLLGEVSVAGLTVAQVKGKVTELLGKDYLVNPQVDVRVSEYHSQFVTVLGEVGSPGRKPLRGNTRIIDALVEAGGLTPRASGEVVITRMGGFEGGERSLRLRLGAHSLNAEEQARLALPLHHGDIISASPKYYVTVEGEVTRPNRYPLEGDLTLSGAVSQAGGLTRFGSSRVKVRRTDPESGKVTILEVDLKDVRKGKEPDPALLPNDVVTVSRRRL